MTRWEENAFFLMVKSLAWDLLSPEVATGGYQGAEVKSLVWDLLSPEVATRGYQAA